ncbi:uncharacterized protein PV09_02369 [Verruconis gallopava]|uniref:Uncharacterized protein n=1 Tax=Verruconis gallopava TaxID=253628 RepID=A0A0D2AIF7_9PEZI|nr:uncharacterized protein PV09_02369 [Verruconis gallopava]KIW06663.1 hypothetical protein PV09_02369 [Verruconis gallopava]
MSLLGLPAEMILAICRQAPLETVANLRLTCRTLNDRIAQSFFAANFATIDIIADDQSASVDAIGRIVTNEATAQRVRHVRVHMNFLFHAIAQAEPLEHRVVDKCTKAVRRVGAQLIKALPQLKNCDTIELVDSFPVCLHHRYPHFHGRKTYIRLVNDGSHSEVWVGRRPLPHQLTSALVFGILTVVNRRMRCLRRIKIEPRLALQDLKANLSSRLCKWLAFHGVHSLKLKLIDCSNEHYRINFSQRQAHTTGVWTTGSTFEGQDRMGYENERKLTTISDSASQWEKQSSRHAMLRVFLKHFPHLRDLVLDIEADQQKTGLPEDMMPAFLSSSSLKTLKLSVSIGDGVTLTKAVEGLSSLETIALEECDFRDLNAFRQTSQCFLRQAHFSLKEIRLYKPWTWNNEGIQTMICPGEACEPYVCRYWGLGGLAQQTMHVSLNVLEDMPNWCKKCHVRSIALTMDQLDLAESFKRMFHQQSARERPPPRCTAPNMERQG